MRNEVVELPSGALVFVDADTGEELLYFVRKYRRRHDAIPLGTPLPYLYLRDAISKRFIKRLTEMEVRFFAVVDYDEAEASKGHPLYLDAVTKTVLTCMFKTERVVEATNEGMRKVRKTIVTDEVKDVERWKDRLAVACDEVVEENFGHYVRNELLEDSGFEYGSEPSVSEHALISKAHFVLVWKHHKTDEPRTKEGETTL